MGSRRSTWRFFFLVFTSLAACTGGGEKVLFDELLKMAEQGDPTAQYHVGMMLNNGIGIGKDPKAAFVWLSKAASAGEPLAHYKIGCYLGGQFEGVVPVDHAKALEHKMIAAQAGYSLAQQDVGNSFAEKGDFGEAVRWWKLAADQGFAPALYNLAIAYGKGLGAPADQVLSYVYMELSKSFSDGQISGAPQTAGGPMLGALSPADLEKAKRTIASWRLVLTPVTVRASSGMEEARKIGMSGMGSNGVVEWGQSMTNDIYFPLDSHGCRVAAVFLDMSIGMD